MRPELRRVYAAVWGTPPDLGTFRRKVLGTAGFVEPVEASSGDGGSLLYRRGSGRDVHFFSYGHVHATPMLGYIGANQMDVDQFG